MAEKLGAEFGVETECVEGRTGEFTVLLNGEVIAEKLGNNFPAEDEVRARVAQRL